MADEEQERPLLSAPRTCLFFLQHISKTQNANTTHWYDIKSCLKRRSKKSDATKAAKKNVHFLTNPQNDKVWCLVKPVAMVDKSLVDELWWTEDEMYMRNESDNDMANYVEHHYLDVLQHAFESTGEGKVDPDTKRSSDVDLDFDEMKKLSGARGLESLVSPEIQKNVKKHRKAVLGAQRILREHGRDLSEDRSLQLIAKSSVKYSQPSRLVSKKMAQFDNEAGKYGFKSMPPSAGSKKKSTKSTAEPPTAVSTPIEQ
eukprot:CAMPEP_0172448788 /NCGR_PEP_ID=MMETSP1065-20121228/7732_1 /TAXON_ID=265537 /ORGANISM="Amphiprora paludosa, Strain CCMP125" /LENGTH=257 /DNA_ID=CAMNT_0013200377 /DNA_START=367 /DNA_END=1140 /DNA_ORIENTATION=+